MGRRKLWKFPWFTHIPDVVTWNVFNCYNHVVAHQDIGTNYLKSIQTPNSPCLQENFPRVFEPFNNTSIILIQCDVKSSSEKPEAQPKIFPRLEYSWHWTANTSHLHYTNIVEGSPQSLSNFISSESLRLWRSQRDHSSSCRSFWSVDCFQFSSGALKEIFAKVLPL